MKKNVNLCVDLKTIMQEDAHLAPGQCYRGILSRTGTDQYLFEEAAPTRQHHRRNPKLFDGKFISMVHMQNGKYQVHMRTISTSTPLNPRDLASQVYTELLEAFHIIN